MWLADAFISALPRWLRRRIVERERISEWLEKL